MDLFVFIIAMVSVITIMIIIYVLYKHNTLRTLVASLALQQVREASASTTKEEDKSYMCNCTSQFYIILDLITTIIGLVIFERLQVRRIKIGRGQLFLKCSQNNAFYIRLTILCAGKIM